MKVNRVFVILLLILSCPFWINAARKKPLLFENQRVEIEHGGVLQQLARFNRRSAMVQARSRKKPGAIKETPGKVSVTTAPPECLTTFRQFFAFVQKTEPSIVKDANAQQKWLSKDLREALKQKVATFKDQPDDPDFPGNGTFVGSWDYPTTFSIIGSRGYGKRAVIEVWYQWGPGTNYPGDTRLTYFIFVSEDGAWKLDDVYTFRGEYASAESLSAYLREK